jgi:predicted nicotinamide N-methyase
MLERQGRFLCEAYELALPVAAGTDDLSVKRFSRRQLLQTGGIATRVWTASVLLARWIAQHLHSLRAISRCTSAADDELFGSGCGRVLELGCGLGVAGITAAMCGCRALLTDVHGIALSSCQAAIRTNAERLQRTRSVRAFRDGGHVESIEEFLDASRAPACGAAFTMVLDWNNLPELLPHERFSCIIAADVVHEDQHAPLVARCIRVRTHAGIVLHW